MSNVRSILLVILLICPLLTPPGAYLDAAERGLGMLRIKDQTGNEISLYRESHALLIGVSDYRAGWPNLPGVEKDLLAIQNVLEDGGFKVVVKRNLDRAGLDLAFTSFINNYGQQEDNRLLFYFAGHGHTVRLAYGDEVGYIVPSDAPDPNRDKTGFLAKALDMQMIDVYAKRIQAKHALFLFDSCFSGSIFSLSRAVPENISYKTARPVRQFITSGSADEQVPDESIFRRQFIAALQGEGDANQDGYLTGTELGEFLQNKVVNYSNGSQHPQYGKIRHPTLDKGDFVFIMDGATIQIGEVKDSKIHLDSPTDPEVEMWNLVKQSSELSDVQDFLKAYPKGRFTSAARLKEKQLQRKQPVKEEQETEHHLSSLKLPLVHSDALDGPAANSPQPLFGPSSMSFEYLNNQGCLTARQANVVLPAMFRDPQVYNFTVEIEVNYEGLKKDSSYGLIFRSDDAPGGLDHYYLLNIQPEYHTVSLMTWEGHWANQQYLKVEPGIFNKEEVNHLLIEVRQDTVSISINSIVIGNLNEDTLKLPGILGLSLISATPNETVCFQNFRIYTSE